MKQRKVFAEE